VWPCGGSPKLSAFWPFITRNPTGRCTFVVIPKRHIEAAYRVARALAPDDLPVVHEMLTLAAELCRDVTAEHGGCRLSTNSGEYQTTKHLHFYIHSGPRLRDEQGAPIAAQA